MLNEALDYARRGFAVLPLARDRKIPLTERGFYDASTDENKICEWWLKSPHANIGLVVGEDSDLLVLDVDNKGGKNGSAELETLERKHGIMPATYTVRTASGGLHYYFKYPNELRDKDLKKALAAGLDLKYNGYVVAPPSIVEGSAYAVVNGSLSELAEWPASLLELCIKEPIDVETPTRRQEGAAEVSLLCEKHNITLADVGLAVPSDAHRTRDGYLMKHPIHGATGSGNLYVNVNKNLWSCYRCDSGGDPITWVAVREGLIDCSEAGTLDKDTFKRCVEILRDEGLIHDDRAAIREPNGSTLTIEIRKCDDLSNAERFVSKYGENLRYCLETKKWMDYDGRCWKDITTTAVKHRALDVVTMIRHEAAEAGRLTGNESEEQKKKKSTTSDELTKWARTSSMKVKIDALIEIAKGYLAISLLAFDRDPLLHNCENGTYDIRTGTLRKHDREDYLRHISGPYIAGAKCEKWNTFLQRAQKREAVRDFLKRASGYSATGRVSEEALFFIFGPPRTGKSTFIEATSAALGSYAKGESFKTFLSRGDESQSKPRPEILRLKSARLVRCIEVSENTVWDSALLNTLVSGEPYTTRALFSNDTVTFAPEFKIWCVANHKPKVQYNPEEKDGFWRRLYPVPFDVEIPESEQDRGLKEYFMKDEAARAAVLAWILEGATEWYNLSKDGHADGLRAPNLVIAARREYEAAQSPLYEFVKNECICGYSITKNVDDDGGIIAVAFGDMYTEEVGELYEVYSDVRKGYDTKKVKNVRSFAKYLKGLGFTRYRDTKDKRYYWNGLRLLKDGEEADGIAFDTWINGASTPKTFEAAYMALIQDSKETKNTHLEVWLNGSINPYFQTQSIETNSHEVVGKKDPFIEPLSHKSETVKEGENSEHFNIPRVRELIFDVLTVLEQQNIGKSPMEAEQLTEQIITLVHNVDPNLSRFIIAETLRKTMTNNDKLTSAFNKLARSPIVSG